MEDEWTDRVSDYIQLYIIPSPQKDREIKGKNKRELKAVLWGLKTRLLHGAMTDMVQTTTNVG